MSKCIILKSNYTDVVLYHSENIIDYLLSEYPYTVRLIRLNKYRYFTNGEDMIKESSLLNYGLYFTLTLNYGYSPV